MNPEIQAGDRVQYRVGKTLCTGTVANVAAGMVTINTGTGKWLNRSLKSLTKIQPSEVAKGE